MAEWRRRRDAVLPQRSADAQLSPRTAAATTQRRCPRRSRRKCASLEAELAADAAQNPAGRLPRCLVRRLLLDAGGYLQRTLLDDADGRWAGSHRGGPSAAGRRRLPRARRRNLRPLRLGPPSARRRGDRAGPLQDDGDRPDRPRVDAPPVGHAGLRRGDAGRVSVGVRLGAAGDGVDPGVTAAAGDWVSAHMAEGALRSLLVDGVIGGVGAVFAFLPQILVLFAFLAVLEDCGYMARTAYLMDRLMVRVGLSGKSFIPLLSSFACAVPGIMATRVIENERDRLTTILVAPLLTCSARLPVYALLIAAFIPAAKLLGRAAEPARADAGRAVPAGNRRGRGGRLAAEADDPPRPDAAVRDGAAQLQVAVAADGVFPHGRARLGVPALRRHADPGRVDPGLGRPLLSRTIRRPRTSSNSATASWAGPAG